MRSKTLISALAVVAVLAIPAVAVALNGGFTPNGQSADQLSTPDSDSTGQSYGWMGQMHDSVWNEDGTTNEWMNQMHDSVWNEDGTTNEWMNQMHDSVSNEDGTTNEWMNQMHDSVSNEDGTSSETGGSAADWMGSMGAGMGGGR